jgi:hypothetical protein
VLIYRPDGDLAEDAAALAPAVATLAGLRIAVLDNGKPNAGLVMTRAAETLASHTGATVSLVTKKGPQGRSANAAVPCAPDIFERVINEADIVITGAADCGSCTAYSVHDTVELERSGRPTVLVTTTKFEPVVRTLAGNSGLADMRTLVLDHPIGGTDATTLTRRADAAAAELANLFTVSSWAREPTAEVGQRAHGFGGRLAERIVELRALVGADGADLEVVDLDDASGTLRLRLGIPDATCAECVMPRAVLEQVATDRLVDLGVRSVIIEDPREDGS